MLTVPDPTHAGSPQFYKAALVVPGEPHLSEKLVDLQLAYFGPPWSCPAGASCSSSHQARVAATKALDWVQIREENLVKAVWPDLLETATELVGEVAEQKMLPKVGQRAELYCLKVTVVREPVRKLLELEDRVDPVDDSGK